jgi:hypothetical protein
VATTSPPRHQHHRALPQSTHDASSTHEPPEALRATGVVLALTAVLALIAIAFALPAAKSKPHDIPIGAVGSPAASGQVADMLEHSAPGAFALTIYPNEAALRGAIGDRDVYGGVVLEPQGRKLLTATGASPTVAQLLTQFGNGMAQQTGVPLRTEDLAPPPAGDPRGTGLAAAALPITLAGFLPVVALTLVVRRDVRIRIAATAVFSGLAGTTIAAVMRYALGSIDQNFWAVAGGLTLGALAAGLLVLGLSELFGRVGLVCGALLALLVGNPLSGLTSAPEMLPSGWGRLGQFLPQGANGTLLRSTAYFGGAGASTAIAVLTCWAVVGSLVIVIAVQRRAFHMSRVPTTSIPEVDRLERLDTQPNLARTHAVPTFRDRAPWRYAPETGGAITRDYRAG